MDPEDVKGTESDNLLDAVTEDPEDPEEQEEEEEEEEDDDDIFSNWLSRYKATEQAKDKEKDEGEDNADMFDRKSSLDPPARPRADRRASLPCPVSVCVCVRLCVWLCVCGCVCVSRLYKCGMNTGEIRCLGIDNTPTTSH